LATEVPFVSNELLIFWKKCHPEKSKLSDTQKNVGCKVNLLKKPDKSDSKKFL